MAKVWVLADESGIHGNPSYCIVGGYIASPTHWESVERAWRKLLERFGVPNFHSKEFFPRTPEGERLSCYKDWTDKKANLFIQSLTTLIHVSELWPVGGVVDVAAFKARSFGEKKLYTGGLFDGKKWYSSGAPSKPYYLAANLMWRTIFERTDPGTIVNVLFDRQEDYEAMAYEFFYHNKQFLYKEFSDKMGEIGFVPNHQVKGLQAADLLVYSWNNYLTRGPEHLRSDSLDALATLTEKRQSFPIANTEFFEKKLLELPQDLRAGLLNTPAPIQPPRVKGGPPPTGSVR